MWGTNPLIAQIVDLIKGGCDNTPDIAKALDLPDMNISITLRRMYKEGIVRRAGKVVKDKPGNPPTKWELNMEPILKKYSAIYCEKGHLFGVILQDMYKFDVLSRKAIELSRDQGHIPGNRESYKTCNLCKSELMLP